ncbi:hypothetical protein AB0L47_37660 [Streptomyces bobili]|uniref:hypothetical protein n=1 Tax=Streptomyces bobili TaxID=67280 RepID=UPI003422674C
MDMQVGNFEAHVGFKKDFELYVGPAREVDDWMRFAKELWEEVARTLRVPLGVPAAESPDGDECRYWFENSEISVSLYVGRPEPGAVERAPAILTAISRSYDVESWQLAEQLYTRLVSVGGYLVAAFTDDGTPIAANFDISDDW